MLKCRVFGRDLFLQVPSGRGERNLASAKVPQEAATGMKMQQPPGETPGSGQPALQIEGGVAYAEATARRLFVALRMQLLVAVAMALALLLVGPVAAYSSLFGGIAVFIPGLVFCLLVVRKLGGSSASFLGAVAMAEVGKLFLTGLLCAAVFIWVKPLAAGWFFTGMIVVLVSSWVGLAKAIR